MVITVRFAGFLGLLFALLAQGDSTDYIKQNGKTTLKTLQKGTDGRFAGWTGPTTDQEFFGGVSTKTADSNKIRLQGRKMLVDNDVKEMRKDEGAALNDVPFINSGATHSVGKCEHEGNIKGDYNLNHVKDAGKGKSASKESAASAAAAFQHKLNADQDHSNMLKPGRESVYLTNTNQLVNPQESKANSAYRSFEGSLGVASQRFEPKKLHEASNDRFMNMMHKDYKGFDKPRRKPPINNYEPLGLDYKPPRMNGNDLLDVDYTGPRKPPTMNGNDVLDADYKAPQGGHAKPPVINNNELLDDYSKPAPKPRRKPPINNNEPLDEDNDMKP